MKIALEQLHEPLDWEETLELPAGSLDVEELRALGPIEVSGRVEPVHPGYHLRLRSRWTETLACTRCLEPREEVVQLESHLLVLTDRPSDEPGEIELDEEDLGVLHVEDDELDTDPLVREQVQLEIPMKSLCRDDCKGLCAQCGANLNEGSCDCRPERDPRWDALAGLRTG